MTVCNIGSRYSQDDGFAGFWGQNVVLRNIHACFNCDQGASFHGNSSTLIDGALIERNGGCGIIDVMSCSTIYRNATVRDNYPGGVLFQGLSHAMYGSRILGNHGTQIEAGKGAAGAIIDHPVLEEPLYLLPKDSPHSKAGENGSTPGAHPAPFKEWMAKK